MQEIYILLKDELEQIDKFIIDNLQNDKNEIYKTMLEFVLSGSKKIRSVLSLLYLKSNSITIDSNIIRLLTAGELIHNASLLHDDVIDDSNIRRNKISFHKIYNPKISILAGDYLLSIAVKLLLQINKNEVIEIFLDTTKSMSNAEIVQYNNREKKISLEDYLSIINGKTSLLFQALLEACAIIAQKDKEIARLIGKYFGILFQINNDLKIDSLQNDKKNGVMTVINILGIEKTNTLKDNYKREINELIKSLPSNEYKCKLKDLVSNL